MAIHARQLIQGTDVGAVSGTTSTVTLYVLADSSLHVTCINGGSAGSMSISSSPAMTWIGLDELGAFDHGETTLQKHWVADKTVAGPITITITHAVSITYRSLIAAEIVETSGYDAVASAHKGSNTPSPGTATDAVTTGNLPTLSKQPALISAFGTELNPFLATTSISAGTGFTSIGTGCMFGGSVPALRYETKRVTAVTATPATFTTVNGTTQPIALAAVFKEGAIAYPTSTVTDWVSSSATGTAPTLTPLATTPVAGNMGVVCALTNSSGTTMTVPTDDSGDGVAWQVAGSIQGNAMNQYLYIFYKVWGTASGTPTITLHPSVSATCVGHTAEFHGVKFLEVSRGVEGFNKNDPGSIALSSNGVAITFGSQTVSLPTIGTGWTRRSTNTASSYNAVADNVPFAGTGKASVDGAWDSLGVNWAVLEASFKPDQVITRSIPWVRSSSGGVPNTVATLSASPVIGDVLILFNFSSTAETITGVSDNLGDGGSWIPFPCGVQLYNGPSVRGAGYYKIVGTTPLVGTTSVTLTTSPGTRSDTEIYVGGYSAGGIPFTVEGTSGANGGSSATPTISSGLITTDGATPLVVSNYVSPGIQYDCVSIPALTKQIYSNNIWSSGVGDLIDSVDRGSYNPTWSSAGATWTAYAMSIVLKHLQHQERGDPYGNKVVLQAINDNAVNGTTTFIDQSPSNKTIVLSGTASYLSGAAPTGMTTCFHSESAGGDLYVAGSEYALGTQDFTLEAVCDSYYTESFALLEVNTGGVATTQVLQLWTAYDGTGTTSTVTFRVSHTVNNNDIVDQSVWGVTNVYHHYAVQRRGNKFTAFIDGIPFASVTSTATVASASGLNINRGRGWTLIGPVRITVGAARYNEAGFISPSLPFDIFRTRPTLARDFAIATPAGLVYANGAGS